MRQLTAKQKKLIKEWMDNGQPEPRDVDDLSPEQWERLQAINDTEILYQEVNRFMCDYRCDSGRQTFARQLF